MLFFEENQVNDGGKCIAERAIYYEGLKNNGKVLLSGNLWNQPCNFVTVHVTSDTELEQIIDNDPAVKQNILKLVRAMPF